jgi:glyoxylase-like metal-dependent hydrolase (beta-lactamase superfamily II)
VDERCTATISQRTAGLGIFPIRLPTPYRIGEVNAYLIADDPLTLIDCGPNWVTSLDSLETQIADAGFALADVGLIVLTHQHPDHMGLVEYLSRRTGAQIACFGPLADVAPEWDDYLYENAGFIHDLMMRHGVERDLADALRPAEDFISKMAPSNFVADRRLADADVLELRDRSLRIYHLPGHSESDIVLHDEQAEVMFAGDHLLKSISSNALMALPQIIASHRHTARAYGVRWPWRHCVWPRGIDRSADCGPSRKGRAILRNAWCGSNDGL